MDWSYLMRSSTSATVLYGIFALAALRSLTCADISDESKRLTGYARTFFWMPSWMLFSCSKTLPLASLLVDCCPRMPSSSARRAFLRSLPAPPFWLSAIFSLTAF